MSFRKPRHLSTRWVLNPLSLFDQHTQRQFNLNELSGAYSREHQALSIFHDAVWLCNVECDFLIASGLFRRGMTKLNSDFAVEPYAQCRFDLPTGSIVFDGLEVEYNGTWYGIASVGHDVYTDTFTIAGNTLSVAQQDVKAFVAALKHAKHNHQKRV